jgi:hypothetical protein
MKTIKFNTLQAYFLFLKIMGLDKKPLLPDINAEHRIREKIKGIENNSDKRKLIKSLNKIRGFTHVR